MHTQLGYVAYGIDARRDFFVCSRLLLSFEICRTGKFFMCFRFDADMDIVRLVVATMS